LFEHDGFRGRELAFGAGDHDISELRQSGLNDTLSSLIVDTEEGTWHQVSLKNIGNFAQTTSQIIIL
jgi:hypothetical protein